MKGDKVIAYCDRNCNVVAPILSAPGNRSESPLLREALNQLTSMSRTAGLDLHESILSLDGIYDCPANRKAILTVE